jgi:BirA family biotin operon repressor/biotin-[acetyl-CoA-carboxylase] ligase
MELDATLRALATPASLLDRYRGMSDTVGRSVRVQVPGEGALVGVATGIDDGGRLLVTTDARTHVILSGTVRDADRSDGLRSNVGTDHE